MTRRVFIVEDEALIVMELEERLTQLGYQVAGHAARGEQAIERITALAPDLVLMDIQLAGAMDGIATAQVIRAARDVPIVFLTGNADHTTIERARAAHAAGVLLKPFREGELRAVLEAAFAS